jgi:hypothetical protein
MEAVMKMAFLTLAFLFWLVVLFCQPTDCRIDNIVIPDYLQAQNSADSTSGHPFKLSRDVSYLAGRAYADSLVDGMGWGITGFFGGFLLNAAGAGVVYLASVAAGKPIRPTNIPPEYDKGGFNDGYSKKAYRINKKSALMGGAFGTAIQIILLLSFFEAVSSADDDDYKAATARPYKMPPASNF